MICSPIHPFANHIYGGTLHQNLQQSVAATIGQQATLLDLLRRSINNLQAERIVSNSVGRIERCPPGVTAPVISPAVANWLALHGFDHEPMRLNHRGAIIWMWRVTRHADPNRPKRSVDLPLHYNLHTVQVRLSAVWPET